MNDTIGNKRPLGTRWCSIGSWIAGIGIALALIGVAGGRTGLLPPLLSFSGFGIGALLSIVSAVVLVIGLALSKGSGGGISGGRAWGSLVGGLALVAIAMAMRPASSGGSVPIHDLTTDLANPPAFGEKMIAARAQDGAQNPPEYSGEATAQAQRAAYPNLASLQLDNSADEVFSASEQIVAEFGWKQIDSDPATGRIEATESTAWFGFRDDVVIRISGDGAQTTVDVRSKSRVGRGDMGANAARIQRFLDRLDEQLK